MYILDAEKTASDQNVLAMIVRDISVYVERAPMTLTTRHVSDSFHIQSEDLHVYCAGLVVEVYVGVPGWVKLFAFWVCRMEKPVMRCVSF